MSQCLTDRGVEHVVLERGRVGERWRNERWDSLRLLTPRWLSKLANWSDGTADPHGFMTRAEVIRYLEGFEAKFSVPVECEVTVTSVRAGPRGFLIDTDRGSWSAMNVVIATGESQHAFVPGTADRISAAVDQVVPSRYKNPSQLAHGRVLVVGASATGIQLASEIHRSGRPVTLSVGRHTRLPRRYRGRDILAWFDQMGMLDQRAEDVKSLAISRAQPSMQLVGSSDHRNLDLGVLYREGVRIVGRTLTAEGQVVELSDDLLENTAAADFKLASLRQRIDRAIRDDRVEGQAGAEEDFLPVNLPDAPDRLDLKKEGICTVLWATGFRRTYPWLRVPVLNARGEIDQVDGVTKVPGLYTLGLNFQIRRSSSFIDGAAKDAAEVATRLVEHRRPRYAVA